MVLMPVVLMNSMPFTTPNTVRTATGIPGKEYWQQEADYTIHVSLDPDTKRITGRESIVYTNNSPDTLHYVWMQSDPNYLSKLSARGRMQTAPHMATENASLDVGYVRALEIREEYEPNLETLKCQGEWRTKYTNHSRHPNAIVSIKPLASTEQLTIELEWSYTMNDASVIWARSGYEILDDESIIFEVAQFYPRMSIYSDLEGWLTKPYLGTGEFATEFGDYDVYITVPQDHIVGSTGSLQNPEEVLSSAQQSRLEKAKTAEEPIFIVKPVEAEQNRITTTIKPAHGTLRLKMFVTLHGGHPMPSYGMLGGAKSMENSHGHELLPERRNANVGSILHACHCTHIGVLFEDGIPIPLSCRHLDEWTYLWNGISHAVLQWSSPLEDGTYNESTGPWKHQKNGLISVIIHEVGHNWFPMIVNNDERSWIWMDEGLNTYVQTLAELEWSEQFEPKRGEPYKIADYMSRSDDVPIMTDADSVTSRGNNAYAKPAAALQCLKRYRYRTRTL